MSEVPPPRRTSQVKTHSLPRRSGATLLRDAAAHAKQERDGRDLLVVDIAEIDAQKVYREAGYRSILAYCMEELQLSEKASRHRIHVGRVAWRLPSILVALKERRLHLTAVSMLAAHVTEKNVDELIADTEGKTAEETRQLVRARFPRPSLFIATAVASTGPLLVAPDVESERPPDGVACLPSDSAPQPDRRTDDALMRSAAVAERPSKGVVVSQPAVALPPERFPLKTGLRRETHEKLRRAKELLGHQIPSGDDGEVIDRALDELIRKLEKQKFAQTDKPRISNDRKASNGRYVPAEVKRTVAQRDGRQCTFVAESGKRCQARSRLEFDHILEVARGGRSTVENVRLRCRAHNQLTAERTFGAEFMERKRRESRQDRMTEFRASP